MDAAERPKLFYHPTAEHLAKLSAPWCASYSGGKDSTSLVTWVEWLRRKGWIEAPRPALVMSDTEVEYPALADISAAVLDALRASGWDCRVVKPRIHEKLYNRILGIGNTPIHPGISSMRWCTWSTKIGPMQRERPDDILALTGLRLGESAMRDRKIKRRGCSAGGECGIPDPDERTYSPLLHWKTCQVVDWLQGHVKAPEIKDLFAVTRRLVEVYQFAPGDPTFDWADPEVTGARFGCIGCPAIGAEREPPKSVVARHGQGHPLNELYDVWFEARRHVNRLWGERCNRQFGPIKMEARKLLFARVMDIQKRAGVVLVTPEDEAFIRRCWAERRYPRGWSEADELTPHPSFMPLFDKGE